MWMSAFVDSEQNCFRMDYFAVFVDGFIGGWNLYGLVN